jgi:hypothetical protein
MLVKRIMIDPYSQLSSSQQSYLPRPIMHTEKQRRDAGFSRTLQEMLLVTIVMTMAVNKNTAVFSGRLFHLIYSFRDGP